MAIVGKYNVLELIRIQKTPYWRLYENNHKRTSGNFIDSADFSDATLDVAISAEQLRRSLDMLSTGIYVLVAYNSKDKTKGGIDTLIEIEGRGGNGAAISGINAAPEFYMEGIGRVTSDNFEAAIDAKIEKVRKEEKKEAEEKAIRLEVIALKKQVAENESGFQKGIMGIGSVVYDIVKNTESGKEFIGLASKAFLGNRNANISTIESVAGTSSEGNEEDRVTTAMERLAKDNPDFIGQLEKLANLKESDPATFEMAVSSLV
jgi:hypothetical protein